MRHVDILLPILCGILTEYDLAEARAMRFDTRIIALGFGSRSRQSTRSTPEAAAPAPPWWLMNQNAHGNPAAPSALNDPQR